MTGDIIQFLLIFSRLTFIRLLGNVLGKRKTENGKRKTENGKRKTENGKRGQAPFSQ
jgi:hypothetical protein